MARKPKDEGKKKGGKDEGEEAPETPTPTPTPTRTRRPSDPLKVVVKKLGEVIERIDASDKAGGKKEFAMDVVGGGRKFFDNLSVMIATDHPLAVAMAEFYKEQGGEDAVDLY
jgi:hypothetical protein